MAELRRLLRVSRHGRVLAVLRAQPGSHWGLIGVRSGTESRVPGGGPLHRQPQQGALHGCGVCLPLALSSEGVHLRKQGPQGEPPLTYLALS